MIPFLVRPVGRTLKPTEADSYPAESLSELRHWTDSRSYTVHRLSLPAARAVLDAQAKDTLARKCRDGTGTWNASLPGCPAERSIQLFRTHESVPLDTLLGGVPGGRARVDRALAGHPLLRALWGCFKPPRCAADGVLRPTRAACPPGVEL